VADNAIAGVYAKAASGDETLVHAYLNEAYALSDVVEVLEYGTMQDNAEGETVLTVTRKDIRDIKNTVDASSFDYDDGFVEMCLDMAAFAIEAPGDVLVFHEKL
jgi:hypothetical protein